MVFRKAFRVFGGFLFLIASSYIYAGNTPKDDKNSSRENSALAKVEILVTDFFGERLSGVNVQNSETGEVYISDFDGKVYIPVQNLGQVELNVSLLGFHDCKININTQSLENKQVVLYVMH